MFYTYLADWIGRKKGGVENGVDSAQEKLAAVETLKQRLELILVGEVTYASLCSAEKCATWEKAK